MFGSHESIVLDPARRFKNNVILGTRRDPRNMLALVNA